MPISGLRSSYSLVGRIVHFGRMLDKIHLQAASRLPADYHNNLGNGFDARTCTFLGIDYSSLKTRALTGGCDEDVLEWAHQHGGARVDDQCLQWNRFMTKIGWRDDRTLTLRERVTSCGLAEKPIETFFDLNDFDEGRDPVANQAWEFKEPHVLLLMGVAGSGKTTVGRILADRLGWRFTDADDFHPPANLAKLSAGTALTDSDRAPWLSVVRAHIETRLVARENTVLACSALKESYRDYLVTDPGCIKLIYLRGTREQLAARLHTRVDHFAPAILLESQLATLEEPPYAFTLDITASPETLAEAIHRRYRL